MTSMHQSDALVVLLEIYNSLILDRAEYVSLRFTKNLETTILLKAKLDAEQKKTLSELTERKGLALIELRNNLWVIMS